MLMPPKVVAPPPMPIAMGTPILNQPKYEYPTDKLGKGQALAMPKQVQRSYVGLGWRGNGGQVIDLDASCIAYSRGQVRGAVSFQGLQYGGNAATKKPSTMVHSGDVLVGQNDAKLQDAERIYLQLDKFAADVDCVVIVMNCYTQGATFANVPEAYIRVCNADTDQELSRAKFGQGSGQSPCLFPFFFFVFCLLSSNPLCLTRPGTSAQRQCDGIWQVRSSAGPVVVHEHRPDPGSSIKSSSSNGR